MMVIDIIAAVVAAALAGLGVGGGGLFVVYLTLVRDVPQIRAQGINLLFFLPAGLISLLIQLKTYKPDKRTVVTLIVFGIAGTVMGTLLSGVLPKDVLRIIFGSFLTVCGAYELFGKPKKKKTAA